MLGCPTVLSTAHTDRLRALPRSGRRTVIVTQGDPEGIGPQLILRLGAARELGPGDRVVADPQVMADWARKLPAPWAAEGWRVVEPLVVATAGGGRGRSQLAALERGVDEVLLDRGAALVTAPIDKKACHDVGFPFAGHTEYLAARAGGCDVAMLLVGATMRVALATIHVPLREVATRLDTPAIVQVGELLCDALVEQFAIEAPRIAVLGLNPHAGEGGLLGDEERDVIVPAMDRLRQSRNVAQWLGPLPADTAFAFATMGRYDAVLAMYHDQGLGPFKLAHLHDGVNMTLGLPFVRTSPDHGTARDIAESGIADDASMRAATKLAREIVA